MRSTKRQQKIFSLVEERTTASVAELAVLFAVSENTIRNDLDALEEQGLVVRTHGGVNLPSFQLPPQLRPESTISNAHANAIVAYACAWIEDGDSLILGDGQLCVMLAERIAHLKNLRVITTSMAVAYILTQQPSNAIVLAGGELDPDTLSTRGSMAEIAIQNFRADKAYFSCTGVSAQNGLTDHSSENAAISKQMKDAANSAYILVDSDRMGKIDLFPIGYLSEARRIITDEGLSHEEAQGLADRGAAKITVCQDGGHQTHRQRASAGRKMRIGFANLSDSVWFAQAVRQSVNTAASRIPEIELLTADNQNRTEIAVANAKYFLDQDVDLLIEYDGTGLANRPIRRLMRQAEVPVIAVDIPMMAATHFGSDHDAAGVSAGTALLQWIKEHWEGRLDSLLLLNNEGGGTMHENGNVRIEDWTQEDYLGTLRPAARLQSAMEIMMEGLSPLPEVHGLALPGDWQTSDDAIATQESLMADILAEIPTGKRVAAISLVIEDALGFVRAVHHAGRCDAFVIISFGHDAPEVHAELNRDDTCLMGIIDLHPERYGEGLLRTAVRLLKGEAVPPAVFVEHSFLSKVSILSRG